MNVRIFDGISSRHHHAVSKVDSAMAHPRRIIGSFEENQIAWFCFCFGNVLAFLPKSIGGGTPHVITILVVDPTDIATAIEPSFRGGATPDVGCAHILFAVLKSIVVFIVVVLQKFCKKEKTSWVFRFRFFSVRSDAVVCAATVPAA